MKIEQALYEALSLTHLDPKPRDSWQMSNMGRCPRFQILQRDGVPYDKKDNLEGMFKMDIGSATHTVIQKALLRAGFLDPEYTWVAETPVVTDSGRTIEPGEVVEFRGTYRSFVFRPDGVWLPDGSVLEIKSGADDAIKRYDYSESFFWQGFGCCKGLTRNVLRLLQVGRSYGLHRSAPFDLTGEWNRKIDEHISDLDSAWDEYKATGKLPSHEHRFKWEDKICRYKKEKK